jgi:putative membrane protein
MKGLLWFGKMLTLLFWWVVLVNLFVPLGQPFEWLIHFGALALLGLHVVELLAFNRRLHGRSHPWFDRLQILLTGIFHVLSIPRVGSATTA